MVRDTEISLKYRRNIWTNGETQKCPDMRIFLTIGTILRVQWNVYVSKNIVVYFYFDWGENIFFE